MTPIELDGPIEQWLCAMREANSDRLKDAASHMMCFGKAYTRQTASGTEIVSPFEVFAKEVVRDAK